MGMEHTGFILNRERKGLKISVRSGLSGLELKERLDQLSTAGSVFYVPGEMTKEPEGYSIYVRNKTSVKEYLAEAALDTVLLILLAESIASLYAACEKLHISFDHVLFDYDAVFISGMKEQLEFIYCPGAQGINRRNNSLTDMLTILQLHTDEESDPLCRNMLGRLHSLFSRWEEGEEKFPAADLSGLIEAWRPERLLTRLRKRMEMLCCVRWQLCLPGVPLPAKEEITVGRDALWADYPIPDSRVSRRHAVLFQHKRQVTVRDLFSVNGTFVNGRRLEAGEEVTVGPGAVVGFGEASQLSVKLRPRILFLSMVK